MTIDSSKRKNSHWAIGSFILGCGVLAHFITRGFGLGMVWRGDLIGLLFIPLFYLVPILFGIKALIAINKNKKLKGKPLAWIGIVFASIPFIVVAIIAVLILWAAFHGGRF